MTEFAIAPRVTDQQWPHAMDAAMAYGFDPSSVPPHTARSLISQIARWEAQLASYKAGLIRVIDDAGVAQSTGATSTSTLISGDFGGDRAGASRQVHAARNLAKATLTDQALAAGELSADKAAVVAGAVAGLPQTLFTTAQRLALADRDHGCTYPGCDRPPTWTEAHHLDHWTKDNGPTQLDNAALLCAKHHHWIHTQNIPGRIQDNHAQFHIHGTWQTNHRWRP